MPLKAIRSPQTTGVPRLSARVLILLMAMWSLCGGSPGAGHCSMATLRGASCRCARRNTAYGTLNSLASAYASGRPATTIGSCVSGIAPSIAGSHWAGPTNALQSLHGHRPGACLPRWRLMVCPSARWSRRRRSCRILSIATGMTCHGSGKRRRPGETGTHGRHEQVKSIAVGQLVRLRPRLGVLHCVGGEPRFAFHTFRH